MIEATMGEVSLFDFIGGEAAVGRLVEAFYARMDTFPEARTIRAMHADKLGTIKTVLKQYLGEWLGVRNVIQPRKASRACAVAISALQSARPSAMLGCIAWSLRLKSRSRTPKPA
jgi:truncated hemoglobin YjbI